MHPDIRSHSVPLPRYSRSMRRIIYLLVALQAAALMLALITAHTALAHHLGRGMATILSLAAGGVISLFCAPALWLARSDGRQHVGMALALAPLAGLAGLSVYLN